MTIQVTSTAFDDGGGEAWTQIPADTGALVLLIQDVDCPTPQPLVHAVAWNLPGQDGRLPEGGLPSKTPGEDIAMGRNSFLKAQYFAPDPVPGHGPHRYYVQLFAVREPLELDGHSKMHTVVKAMTGRVTARGLLIGI